MGKKRMGIVSTEKSAESCGENTYTTDSLTQRNLAVVARLEITQDRVEFCAQGILLPMPILGVTSHWKGGLREQVGTEDL